MKVVPYRGVKVGCTWCAYEAGGTGSAKAAQPATLVITTSKGDREVCELHAMRGHWRDRRRRVGKVAA